MEPNRVDLSKQAIAWGIDYFNSKRIKVSNYEKVAHTSYSSVHQIQTEKGVFYLKQTPIALFSEPKMLTYLADHGCRNIPKVIAYTTFDCSSSIFSFSLSIFET